MEPEFSPDFADSASRSYYIPATLFAFEVYHAVAHACILFRLRLLPRKDLVRVRIYFLIDLLTVTCSALYTRELLWLAALQNIQHAFFFLTWNQHGYCKKIINWSSLDWFWGKKSEDSKDEQTLDLILGTAFDMLVHVVYAYYLWRFLAPVEYICGLLVVAAMTKAVLFNSRFAWSSPRGIPAWVCRRIQPLPQN